MKTDGFGLIFNYFFFFGDFFNYFLKLIQIKSIW